MMMNEQTRTFADRHAGDDVRKLALQGTREVEVDLTAALQQIAGRQTARRKLPTWAATDGIVYPPHLNMEQCSSERTACYKAQVAGTGSRLVDLTGGFGVDCWAMSQGFERSTYVERDEELSVLAAENFRLLGCRCDVVCADAADYLVAMEHADVVFLDPARRDGHGARTYSIADCTPNVLELLPMLRTKADRVVMKLSPMLDWRKAVQDVGGVAEVHIVSVDNECKELLLVLDDRGRKGLRLVCVNNDERFVMDMPEPSGTLLGVKWEFTRSKVEVYSEESLSIQFLYEPNASLMKAGCFAELERRFGVRQVADNSHLFLSAGETDGFPGRGFRVLASSSMNKRELDECLAGLGLRGGQANVAVRNFPLSVEQLRKRLKLRDGGDTYVFATTTADGGHRLFFCRKIG